MIFNVKRILIFVVISPKNNAVIVLRSEPQSELLMTGEKLSHNMELIPNLLLMLNY